MPNVFLCHSSSDSAVVQKLAERLLREGVKPWYDKWEIRAGDSLTQKISAGIESCDAFVIVVSRASTESKWVKRELHSAIALLVEKGIRVIPARLDSAPLPSLIGDLRWTELAEFEKAVKEILDAVLGRELGPQPAALPATTSPFGLSPLALRLGKWLIDNDRDGYELPDCDLSDFATTEGVNKQDAEDVARELQDLGLAAVEFLGNQVYASARHGLAVALPDSIDYNPGDDLRKLAEILQTGSWMTGDAIRNAIQLTPVRINRAVLRMKSEEGADVHQTTGTAPFAFHQVRRNHRTRKYL